MPSSSDTIAGRLDALHADVQVLKTSTEEIKRLAEATNGRVRTLELWKARAEGAKAAVGWVPPFLTAAGSSVVASLLTAAALGIFH